MNPLAGYNYPYPLRIIIFHGDGKYVCARDVLWRELLSEAFVPNKFSAELDPAQNTTGEVDKHDEPIA
jgi:hypothetical protein